jgi:hypothetical protein
MLTSTSAGGLLTAAPLKTKGPLRPVSMLMPQNGEAPPDPPQDARIRAAVNVETRLRQVGALRPGELIHASIWMTVSSCRTFCSKTSRR